MSTTEALPATVTLGTDNTTTQATPTEISVVALPAKCGIGGTAQTVTPKAAQ